MCASSCGALGTDSSSLYRHFRNKTELLRAVADRILAAAMEGYRPEGDWKQRITATALRLRESFGEHPQLAAVWGRYASGGAGFPAGHGRGPTGLADLGPAR